MKDRYYAASPYNLVRIILGRREPDDNTAHNVYTRAAAYGRDWRGSGIFRPDSSPSIFTYSQTFTPPSGSCFERRGCISPGPPRNLFSPGPFFPPQNINHTPTPPPTP